MSAASEAFAASTKKGHAGNENGSWVSWRQSLIISCEGEEESRGERKRKRLGGEWRGEEEWGGSEKGHLRPQGSQPQWRLGLGLSWRRDL